ncbi:MAG: glycosyltransferase family 4 protein [Acidobacteriota bacterium]|nr:glycosyltransferase family 4 protein [Acidobacteriota bacterium]MDH3522934.1 glycosyltransferase family 4 protein [Acidobacteriota bacterium]
MRIAQVVADGRPGGGTVMVLSLVEHLVARGAEVCLATDAGSYAADRGRALGAAVAELPFFSLGRASRRLAAALDGFRPGVVHAHGSRAGFHLVPWSRRRPSVATHYTVHGYHFQHRSLPRLLAGRWAERRTGRRLRSVIHVCDHDCKLAQSWRLIPPAAACRVIYNGVDVDALPAAAPAGPPRAVFIGRLVPQKDPELAAAIARRLAAAGVPVTLVGGGAGEPRVRRRLAAEIAAGRVAMTGEVDRERALAELAGAAVLVLPSRWEGLPVVVLEALAVGVPVVAAAVGGVPEALAGGAAGVLLAERDPERFAAEVQALLADGDRRRRLVAAGRALAAERFRLADCLERYADLYCRGDGGRR